MDKQNLNKLSEQLLLKIKIGEETTELRKEISLRDIQSLKAELSTDELKKGFWINIYNSYFLILRKEMGIEKPDIYKKKLNKIAGKMFSLDDIEHGILRKYRYKYSLGFFSNLFTSKLIKKLAVDNLDYRIHFALNCGAKSCPPIAFYNSKNINIQLDSATQSFLEGETVYDEENEIVYISSLFKWYYADFGSDKGIKDIYKIQMNKDITFYKIKYSEYSWEENLDNFI